MNHSLQENGFVIQRSVMSADTIATLRESVAPLMHDAVAGIRGLAHKLPTIRELADSAEVRSLVEPVLGQDARLIRSVLFNKDQTTNWQVTWHQDLAITVHDKADIEGYTNWTIKDNAVHVQPPVTILQHMLTVRLHLDDTDETNGALWVSPATHLLGRIAAAAAASTAEQHGQMLCSVKAGDALLFHPLLLHASRKTTSRRPRRIIHLEFSAIELPAPLKWNDQA